MDQDANGKVSFQELLDTCLPTDTHKQKSAIVRRNVISPSKPDAFRSPPPRHQPAPRSTLRVGASDKEELFHVFVTVNGGDDDTTLRKSELRRAISDPRMKAVLKKFNNFGLATDYRGNVNVDRLWDFLDTNRNGAISMTEFMGAQVPASRDSSSRALTISPRRHSSNSGGNRWGFEAEPAQVTTSPWNPTFVANLSKLFDRVQTNGGFLTSSTPLSSFLSDRELKMQMTESEVASLVETAGVGMRLAANLTVSKIFNSYSSDGTIKVKQFLEVATGMASNPRNTTWGGRSATVRQKATVASDGKFSRPLQLKLRKVYDSAEKSKGVKAGSYINPDTVFSDSEKRIKLNYLEAQSALGHLNTFNPGESPLHFHFARTPCAGRLYAFWWVGEGAHFVPC